MRNREKYNLCHVVMGKLIAGERGVNDVFNDIKIPVKRKKRAKETRPRLQPEKEFRKTAIAYLERKACRVKRVENGICGRRGDSLGDLWVFCNRTKWAGWVELKSLEGRQSEGQIQFMADCIVCNVNYIVARQIEDLFVITGEDNYAKI